MQEDRTRVLTGVERGSSGRSPGWAGGTTGVSWGETGDIQPKGWGRVSGVESDDRVEGGVDGVRVPVGICGEGPQVGRVTPSR